MSHQKRRRSQSPSSTFASLPNFHSNDKDISETTDTLSGLHIEAFEAELCDDEWLGQQAESRCDEIEGGRLIRLGGNVLNSSSSDQGEGVWVDRYDARLLLPTTPPTGFEEPTILTPPPVSPTGYSDLPSDHEEMFYFDESERQEIAQRKQRRKRDEQQHKRIRLREEEEKQREENIRLSKIPPPDQMLLMSRTLEALNSSPSPSLLEIRILANHYQDSRFASFLGKDGKYRLYWEEMKLGKHSTKNSADEQPKVSQVENNGLQGIADYGESSDEAEVGEDDEEQENVHECEEQNQTYENDKLEGKTRSAIPVTSDPLSPTRNPSSPAGELVEPIDPSDEVLPPGSPTDLVPIIDDSLAHKPIDEAERLRRQARAKEWAAQRKKLGSPAKEDISTRPPDLIEQ
ncbi:uncharacterized protein MELLADRAFT_102807 [Melampsora larici-populina 98AG31]|uniref:SURP motif domain-containing protein n=1 Tax=Melampsora larici-populina (strain 98AG31 / pathotype 3-4-7) TaxID=747676 RepID=F4R9F8_MELLP|nr:uncharacterized protein MELLADRAFT_102807 [Melampsora larici-populina 98AG31]EGG10975.1 hypothetical protein MELLADRAFT_102807 [Melampsora larici-populina 98AG31]